MFVKTKRQIGSTSDKEERGTVARAEQGEKNKWRGGANKRSKSRGRLLEDLSEKSPDRAPARANSSPQRRGTVDGQQCCGRATSGTRRLQHESAP